MLLVINPKLPTTTPARSGRTSDFGVASVRWMCEWLATSFTPIADQRAWSFFHVTWRKLLCPRNTFRHFDLFSFRGRFGSMYWCILRHKISLFYWSVFVGKPIRWWELDRGNSARCLFYYLRWRRFKVSFLVVFITIFLSFALFIVLELTVIHNDDYFQCPARATASSHGKDEQKNLFYCREPKETRGHQREPPAGERKVKNRTTKEGEAKPSWFLNFSPEFNLRNSKWTKGE